MIFFRLLIVGPSGSGKTNLLMHLLFKPLVYYDKIILYAKNLEQHYYQELTRRFEKIAEKLGADIEDLQVSNQEVEDLDNVPNTHVTGKKLSYLTTTFAHSKISPPLQNTLLVADTRK